MHGKEAVFNGCVIQLLLYPLSVLSAVGTGLGWSARAFLCLAWIKWTQDSVHPIGRIILFHAEARGVIGSTCLHKDVLYCEVMAGEFFMIASNACASPTVGWTGNPTTRT